MSEPIENVSEGLDLLLNGVQATNVDTPPNSTPSTPPVPPPDTTTPVPPDNNLQDFNSILPLLTNLIDNSNEDISSLRSSLLETFNGKNFSNKGDLLDSKGEVLLTSEQLKTYIDTEELPKNEKGEIVNAKGEVLNIDLNTEPLINEVRTTLEAELGLTFPEDFTVKDTTKGIVDLTVEAIKRKSISAVKDFLEAYPEVKGFFQHMQLGGNPKDYSQSNIDYKSINIKTLSEDSKLDLLTKAFTAQSVPNKDNLISLIKNAGEEELNKNVAGAILYLDKKQEEVVKGREEQIKQQLIVEQEETNKYWNSVEQTIVSKGKLGTITIPNSERRKFFEYLSKPINDNLDSQNSLASEKDSLEFELLVDYLRYKGGDISKLAQHIANEQRVSTLRERASKLKGINGSSNKFKPNTPKNNVSDSSLDILLG